MVTFLPSYHQPIYCFPSLGSNAVSLGNNKIAVCVFRCFHLFLGTILKKIFVCAFGKGHESRAYTKFSGVCNYSLALFTCFQKCKDFYCQSLQRGHIRKTHGFFWYSALQRVLLENCQCQLLFPVEEGSLSTHQCKVALKTFIKHPDSSKPEIIVSHLLGVEQAPLLHQETFSPTLPTL